MNFPTLVGQGNPKRDITSYFKNVGTAAILKGSPVCFVMNGTNDGIDVANAADALVGVNKCVAYFVGIALEDIAVNDLGNVLRHGVCSFVRCSASVAVETSLTINSATNDFVGAGTVAAFIAITTTGPAAVIRLVNAVATATVEGVTNVSTRVLVRGL